MERSKDIKIGMKYHFKGDRETVNYEVCEIGKYPTKLIELDSDKNHYIKLEVIKVDDRLVKEHITTYGYYDEYNLDAFIRAHSLGNIKYLE